MFKCQICEQPAHGQHFGVVSCRACAAFYRRATLNPKKKILPNCIHEDGKKMDENGVFSCRRCRLKKCLKKGMDASKFQLERDLISSSLSMAEIPQTLSTFLGRPNFLLFCNPLEPSTTAKTVVDFSCLLERANELLKNGRWNPYNSEISSLEKMAMRYENMQIIKSSRLRHLSRMGKDETILIWEQKILNTTDWLTNFNEFNVLPLDVQLKIVKTIWQVYGRFEKIAKTAELRRKKLIEHDNVFMVGDEACLNSKNVEMDVSWYTDYSFEQIAYFMDCFHDDIYLQIVKEFETLNPTPIELNFMLLQVCLHHAGKKLHGDMLELTDYLQEVISNQLHNHYLNVRKMPNYSARLARMMKVNNLMRTDLRRQSEKVQLAMAFDVFKLELSHPEVMC
ncbi:Nuclear Hormone Receptor family [Caenorhabditis elegans]|uniref:Nuclear Hormone Receptor family n=1 Tax=Caenorhabditis elegans TaxID=6239 RepID=O16677_CAEEL|nr:Nuclear Hormone Receptor family [Caenorhabditis elegans]CCD70991.1 Nuclear Hormone Receptor family [Caenorhabditis elegans]|eukprot:NP_503621.1 Nuclear Hormone Receptor family [Caenorhabditis elegans]